MATNVEIKARLKDFDNAVKIAEKLSDTPREVILQEDIFFNVAHGRLKLRIFNPERGELIYYERPDAQGPKSSNYEISPTENPAALQRVLQLGLGVRGVVRKTRWLYLVGPTRIHIDQVEGLGNYLELEVVMLPGEDAGAGDAIANDLMESLGILDDDLLSGAYIDLIESNHARS